MRSFVHLHTRGLVPARSSVGRFVGNSSGSERPARHRRECCARPAAVSASAGKAMKRPLGVENGDNSHLRSIGVVLGIVVQAAAGRVLSCSVALLQNHLEGREVVVDAFLDRVSCELGQAGRDSIEFDLRVQLDDSLAVLRSE
jgi:hypothetical protein